MGAKTGIEWTDATWNPVSGCTKVSAGCKFCYAERITERFGRQRFTDVVLHPERLDMPLRWQKPRRIFVNSMSDLFHEQVPDEFIGRVFDAMAMADHHVFQVLTKREQRMCTLLRRWRDNPGDQPRRTGFPNIWLGISAEDQKTADKRIPLLLQTPAAVRFVSLEPLLEPVDLGRWLFVTLKDGHKIRAHALHWVICGGESGGPPERALVERYTFKRKDLVHYPRSALYVKPEALTWVRSIRNQCCRWGVPFFFKQWGGPTPKSGGRLLDGRTWEEFPPS